MMPTTATEDQAIQGTNNTAFMTPLRTKQSILNRICFDFENEDFDLEKNLLFRLFFERIKSKEQFV